MWYTKSEKFKTKKDEKLDMYRYTYRLLQSGKRNDACLKKEGQCIPVTPIASLPLTSQRSISNSTSFIVSLLVHHFFNGDSHNASTGLRRCSPSSVSARDSEETVSS